MNEEERKQEMKGLEDLLASYKTPKINRKDRLHIISMYPFAKTVVKMNGETLYVGPIEEINIAEEEVTIDFNDEFPSSSAHWVHLVLKRLETISEDHIIGLFQMVFQYIDITEEKPTIRYNESKSLFIVEHSNALLHIGTDELWFNAAIYGDLIEIGHVRLLNLYDQLRKWEYGIPTLYGCPFELEVAITEEEIL